MRTEEFKMEREQLLDKVYPGAVLKIAEYKLPNSYYYVLGNAYACSANFRSSERIAAKEGRVVEVEHRERGFYVKVEVE